MPTRNRLIGGVRYINMTNQISTYYFIGKFEPHEECSDFNPGELDIGNGWILDIFRDLACIWNSKVSSPFKDVSPFIHRAFALATALFIFRSKIMIDHRFSHWIEAKEVQASKNIIGAYVSRFSEPRRNARINVHWKKTARIFPKIIDNQFVRLALKDYISAIKDTGDDAYFFAYRSVENICRFISGAQDEFKTAHWNKMHKELGTTKSYIDPLLSVATDIRHGNFDGSSLTNTRKSRQQILDISSVTSSLRCRI